MFRTALASYEYLDHCGLSFVRQSRFIRHSKKAWECVPRRTIVPLRVMAMVCLVMDTMHHVSHNNPMEISALAENSGKICASVADSGSPG